MAPHDRPEDLAAAIAPHVAAIVALLVRPSAPTGPTHYSSSGKIKILPPGVNSTRAFAARCATTDGAYREGRGWVCPVEAWHAARAARPAPPPVDDPESLLAAAGVRLRRGAR